MITLEDSIRMHLERYFAAHKDIKQVPGRLHECVLEIVEKPLIEVVLAQTGGNQIQAARILGINRNTLRKKMAMLSIKANGEASC